MDPDVIISFVNKLSNETVRGVIKWNCLTNLETVTQESNKELFYLLFQSSCHHIDFLSSYYAILDSGTVYLVNETFESGRDGTVTSGYNLYIQSDDSSKIDKLNCLQAYLYQIVNSIQVTLPKNENTISSFVSNYLKND